MTQDNGFGEYIKVAKAKAAMAAKTVAASHYSHGLSQIDYDFSYDFVKKMNVQSLPTVQFAKTPNVLSKIKLEAAKAAGDLGGLLFHNKEYDEAIYACQYARNMGSTSDDVIVLQGDAHYAVEKYAESLGFYQEAINKQHPRSIMIKYCMGNAYYELQRWAEALEKYEDAIKDGYFRALGENENSGGSEAILRAKVGLLYLHTGKYQLAINWLNVALNLDPESKYIDIPTMNLSISDAHTALGDSLKHNNTQKATKCYDAAVQYLKEASKANTWDTLVNTGNSYYRLKHYSEAIDCYKKARYEDNNRDPAEIFYREGLACLQIPDEYSRAIFCFQKALDNKYPNEALIKERMATGYLYYKLPCDAKRHYKAALKASENDDPESSYITSINAGLGEAYFMLEEYGDAIDSFRLIKEQHTPYFTKAQLRIGESYFSLKNWKLAKKFFKSAIKSSKKFDDLSKERIADIKYNLSLVSMHLAEYKEVIKFSNEAIEAIESLGDSKTYYIPQIKFSMGKAYFNLGNKENGLKYLNEAKALAPRMDNIIDKHIAYHCADEPNTANVPSESAASSSLENDSRNRRESDTEDERNPKRACIVLDKSGNVVEDYESDHESQTEYYDCEVNGENTHYYDQE